MLIAPANLHDDMEARKYIIEIFQVVSTTSILLVLPEGKVKRLYCPFWAISMVKTSSLEKGQKYSVEAVKMTLKLEEVFIIDGKAYYTWYFKIIV